MKKWMTVEHNISIKNGMLENSLFKKKKGHLLTRVFLEKNYFL